MNTVEIQSLKKTAALVRLYALEGIYNAQSGHPGGSLSVTDVLTYLYFKGLNVDPKNPQDPKRDRFVLSKGHTAPALYGCLGLRGFFDIAELKSLRKMGAMLQGHPDMRGIPGVDMSTGSLGQGVSTAVGMALSAKIFGDQFRVYTVLGDGELQEGQVWEAAMLSGHKNLDNLCAFIDNNGLQIDGKIEDVNSPYPIREKFEAFGWNVIEIDGHDFEQIDSAFTAAKLCKGKPTAVIFTSVKGKGVSYMENNAAWHGMGPNTEQYEIAVKEINEQIKQLEANNG